MGEMGDSCNTLNNTKYILKNNKERKGKNKRKNFKWVSKAVQKNYLKKIQLEIDMEPHSQMMQFGHNTVELISRGFVFHSSLPNSVIYHSTHELIDNWDICYNLGNHFINLFNIYKNPYGQPSIFSNLMFLEIILAASNPDFQDKKKLGSKKN